MDYEIEYAIQMLYIAKIFYDHDKLDTLLIETGRDVSLSWDELGMVERAGIGCVFADSRYYYQQDKRRWRDEYEPDRDVYVLRDPLLTHYDDLCRKLEAKKSITKVENQFSKDLDSAIHRCMQFSDYNYDYRWLDSTQDRKGAKIVLFLFEEFGAYYDAIYSLFAILDFCEENIPNLEKALAEADKNKIIQLPVQAVPEKEAA